MKMIVFFLLTGACIHADNWTISDGTTYKNVHVLSHDDAYVTILDSDGGGKIPLRVLSPDLQKKFGYDATRAKAAEAVEDAQDKANRAALQSAWEKQQEAKQAQQQQAVVYSAMPAATTQSASPSQQPPANNDQIAQAQRKDIQDQIDSLQSDINEMTLQQAKDKRKTNISHGGLADKIAEDQAKINQLQSQLTSN